MGIRVKFYRVVWPMAAWLMVVGYKGEKLNTHEIGVKINYEKY